MTQRNFDTECWTSDAWFQGLPRDAKLLFIYAWTNSHCSPAGLYAITIPTIAFEAGFTPDEVRALLPSLAPHVVYYPEHNLLWVRAFLRRQGRSPKFLAAAASALGKLPLPDDLRAEFTLHNAEMLTGVTTTEGLTRRECVLVRDNFLCQYCGAEIMGSAHYEMDHVIPVSRGGRDNYQNLVTACRACNQNKLDRTPTEVGMITPTPSTFHAKQALALLRENDGLRERWLAIFPQRYTTHPTLANVDPGYSPPKPRAQSPEPESSTPKPPHDAAAGAAAGTGTEEGKKTGPALTNLGGQASARIGEAGRRGEDRPTALTPDQEAVMKRATALYAQNVSPMGMPGIALEEMQEFVVSGARVEDLEYAWRAAAGHAKGARMTWALPRAILRRLQSEGWPAERNHQSGPAPPAPKAYDPGFVPTPMEEITRGRTKAVSRPAGDSGAARDRAGAGG